MPKDEKRDRMLRDILNTAVDNISLHSTGVWIETSNRAKLRSLLYRFIRAEANPDYLGLKVTYSTNSLSEVWIVAKKDGEKPKKLQTELESDLDDILEEDLKNA